MKVSGTSRLVAPVIASVATVFFISFASSLVGTPPTDGNPSGNVVIDSGTLPKWVTGHQQDFAVEMIKGSGGLTDKVNHRHLFQYIYQPSLSRLVREKLSSSDPVKTIRLLEFGLGCHPSGGMINGKPGGSAFGWRHLFGPIGDVAFELYIFEFDEACAKKWLAENPHTVDKLLIGDASSEADLQRAYDEAGGKPFDVVIDDASHINWHQIKTLDVMLPRVAAGGFYVVEDIQGSCHGYRANMGSYVGEDVGGSGNCMTTTDGKETILAHLMEYQRCLIGQRDHLCKPEFLSGVTKIEIHWNSALLSKEVQIGK